MEAFDFLYFSSRQKLKKKLLNNFAAWPFSCDGSICKKLCVTFKFSHVFLFQVNPYFYSIPTFGVYKYNYVLERHAYQANPHGISPTKVHFIHRQPAPTTETEWNYIFFQDFSTSLFKKIQVLSVVL
ncbi:hypothetical protein CFP56_035679 [Quercus suber]|uniref:Uncharacterized protein n=1 Tax=Quercus suber TaxID=58331 RepID=A0AAW0J974_QUESU